METTVIVNIEFKVNAKDTDTAQKYVKKLVSESITGEVGQEFAWVDDGFDGEVKMCVEKLEIS